ncbi:uncharacterized protein LOC116853206 [Odontomachus brunneus]|uniref:uncharacterized protein LOC116853206 n=1 Tax=Odontomachus brunneus TaxID=486640 RepID=UPI0013F1BDB6|nr:uncharacterized protein LOC116853206 [Odontomachus brunneus]
MTKTLDQPTLGPSDRTEKLTKWIHQVSHKVEMCSSKPKRDLRVQAMLNHTLHKAKDELKSKQMLRMARWQQVKKELLKDVYYGSCATYHAIEVERQAQEILKEQEEMHRRWYQEFGLDELDNFLRQISEVKTQVNRNTYKTTHTESSDLDNRSI